MANTMLLIPPTLAYPLSGTEPVQHGGSAEPWFKETASQTYVIGDLIYLDSNGTIAIATVTTVGGVSQLNSAILGMPMQKATGTTGTAVPFKAITPNDIYIMNAYHSTKASAVFAQNQLGTRLNIVKSAAGLWHVDVKNALSDASPMVRIVGFPSAGLDTNGNFVTNAAVADVYGLAYVQFRPTYTSTDDQLDALQMWS